MAGLTQAQAQAQLALYLTAEEKVLAGQEYSIGSRRMRRADLKEIREGIEYWNSMVNKLATGSGARARGLTPG